MTTDKCFCLACDPKGGEIGRDCIRSTDKELKPTECLNGCPENQVCDYCQGVGGKDATPPTDGLRSAEEWWERVRSFTPSNVNFSKESFLTFIQDVQQNALASQSEKLRVMREALTTIAKQKYIGEQDKDEDGEIMGCLETGYDDIIELARRAIALADKE